MARTSNFLSALSDDTLLNEITVPGSHDAGVYEGATDGRFQGLANAQDRDIGSQCRGGSRFFDIRIKDGRADHGGYKSATLDKILNDVVGFLGSGDGKSEFVILRFSKSNKQNEITEAVKKIDKKLLLLGDRNIATTKLGDARGKLIACFAADQIVKKGVFGKKSVKEQFGLLIDPDAGIHSFKKMKGDVADGETGLVTCGVYSNSPSIEDVWKGQLKRAEEHHTHTDGRHLSVLYWTLTQRKRPQWEERNIGKLTKGKVGTHNKTDDLVVALTAQQQHIKDQADTDKKNNIPVLVLSNDDVQDAKKERKSAPMPKVKLPNVIMYDFVNPATSEKIIYLNRPWFQG